jgi:hypothetical protein
MSDPLWHWVPRKETLTLTLEHAPCSKKSKKGMHALLRELSDNEDETTNAGPNVPEDPKRPWLKHFQAFMDTIRWLVSS